MKLFPIRNPISKACCLLTLVLPGCGPEDTFDSPQPDCDGFGLPGISLEALKARYPGETVMIADPLEWEGYVVSTDEASNLFGEIYLQDAWSQPEGGMVLYTDLLETHSALPYGSRVVVKLTGLYLGNSSGAYELGAATPSFGNLLVGRLPAALLREHVKVLCDGARQPKPTVTDIQALSDRQLNTLVEVKGVEFPMEEVGLPYAEPGQQTRRVLQDCHGDRIHLRNSGYSDFRADPLPGGHGSATGILARNRNRFELLLRGPGDLRLADSRCSERFEKKSSDRILISEIADPDNHPEARFIELFNASDTPFDLYGWELIRFTNDNPEPGPPVSLDGMKLLPGDVLVISAYPESFEEIYGFPPDATAPRNGPADSNGDDAIVLVDPFGNAVDVYGSPGRDGSGTAHEFEDGKALRRIGIKVSSPVFIPLEWEVYNDSGGAGTRKEPQSAPGDFSPGVHL